MRDRKSIQVVAALVTVSAVAAMVVSNLGFGPGFNAEPHRAAGAELARQTLSLLKPGGQITVITRNTTTFQNPASDFLLDGFQRELRRAHAGISDLQKLQVDPLRLVEVPSGDFQQWIHHAKTGDVIVSFMGPPLFSPEQRRQLKEIQPAIVAFCPGNWPERVDFRPLFETGLLQTAIVTKGDLSQSMINSRKFEQSFAIVTKANVEDFMAGSAKPLAARLP